MNMLSQIVAGQSIGSVLISLIIIAGCVAIVLVAVRTMNITIPAWITNILWIVLVVAVAIASIRFLLTL